jgi:PDZ domain
VTKNDRNSQAEVPRLSPEVEPPAATPVPEPAAPALPKSLPPLEAPPAVPDEEDLTPVAAAESTIRMGKAPAEPLGIAVEAEGGAFGGAVVSAVLPGGAAHRDGRLKAGAELLSVNNENLRRVSQAQTNAILRRAALQSAEVR